MSWQDDYRDRIRAFMLTHGEAVQFNLFREVSPYGWEDSEINGHAHTTQWYQAPCRWVIPEGALLTEERYSMFEGTFAENRDELGVNVTGCRCACGKYTDVTLRWVGSLADILWAILELPAGRRELSL